VSFVDGFADKPGYVRTEPPPTVNGGEEQAPEGGDQPATEDGIMPVSDDEFDAFCRSASWKALVEETVALGIEIAYENDQGPGVLWYCDVSATARIGLRPIRAGFESQLSNPSNRINCERCAPVTGDSATLEVRELDERRTAILVAYPSPFDRTYEAQLWIEFADDYGVQLSTPHDPAIPSAPATRAGTGRGRQKRPGFEAERLRQALRATVESHKTGT
jgi:hypothetical protein